MENGLVLTEEDEHRNTTWSSNSIPRHVPKRTEHRYSNSLPQVFIPAPFTTAQKAETTQMLSAEGQINKTWQEPYGGLLSFNHKKKWRSDTCYNASGLENTLLWKEARQKVTYCMKCPGQANPYKQQIRGYQGWWKGEMGPWCLSYVTETFWNQTRVVVAQHGAWTEHHWTGHFKMVTCIWCEFLLNKKF